VPSKEKESRDRDGFRGFGGEIFERTLLEEDVDMAFEPDALDERQLAERIRAHGAETYPS